MYWPQDRSFQSATTSSEGSYTITVLAPAATYTVIVDTQTQLGYGFVCCTPTVTVTTHSGKPSDACMGHNLLMASKYCFKARTPLTHALT